MKKLKFCCKRFQSFLDLKHQTGPNIRIIKLDPKIFPDLKAKKMYSFYITVGYSEGEKGVARMMISHCPFCGRALERYYASDEYVNEHNHDFITVPDEWIKRD